MDEPRKITETFSATAQLHPEDMTQVAELGFKAVVNNRPDGEGGPEQPSAEGNRAAAEDAGLAYLYLPMTPNALSPQLVDEFAGALGGSPGPVLAHCKSGARSVLLWALVETCRNGRAVDEVLAQAAEAGFDLSQARPLVEYYAAQMKG